MSGERRVTVRYDGHVQGIGFRFTVCSLAAGRPVAGFVRNEPDGTVTLVAEGDDDALQGFLAAVRHSRVGRYVVRESPVWSRASGEFDRFGVAY
jgi:acylphosphatase